MKDVSVIVVTFNEDIELLQQCFDSVYNSKDIDFQLIVLDNGMRDEVRKLVHSYEGASYIQNAGNLGFAAAVNIGIGKLNAKYYLLLNPDASFAIDVLRKMFDHMENDQEVGVSSCIITYPNGDLQESIRRFPTPWNQLQVLLKIPHFIKTSSFKKYMMADVDPYKTQDVNSIMGAFMWIRHELVEQIGMLDDRYWIWFEEVDYCKMCHDAGCRIRHYADVEITHHKGYAFGKILTLKKQKWIRTSLRKFIKKHYGLRWWLIFWALNPIFIVLALISAIIKPR